MKIHWKSYLSFINLFLKKGTKGNFSKPARDLSAGTPKKTSFLSLLLLLPLLSPIRCENAISAYGVQEVVTHCQQEVSNFTSCVDMAIWVGILECREKRSLVGDRCLDNSLLLGTVCMDGFPSRCNRYYNNSVGFFMKARDRSLK